MNAIIFGNLTREYYQLKKEIDNAIQTVLDSGRFLFGGECNKFEQVFADYCGATYCVGVASGTEALMLSLMALGVKEKDFIVTVPNTAMPTVSAISMVGAEPIFVDIEKSTMLMDPEKLKALLKSLPAATLNKIKAIVPVHLYGHCVDMASVMKLADKHNCYVLEDASQSHGTVTADGRLTGNIGHISAFSLYPGKNLGALGDAGIVTTNDKSLAENVTMLRNYGSRKKYYYEFKGYNNRMDTIQAIFLKEKLKHLKEWNASRLSVASYYNNNIKLY